MSQEMNKKAVADLFCIEDARAVCEAIGGLGLNPGNEATDEPLEYTPDNILDVTVNENPDGMPAFPQVGQSDMDDETKAFVVDELSKQLQADGRESLSAEDLVPFAVKIKGENHISQDLVSFIDQLTSGADARLSTQNTSEAQPNGVATDLTNAGEGEAAAEPAAPEMGADTLPPEAPGGLAEPAEAPALETNPDAALGDEPAAPAADGEFNLDVPEPAAEVAPAADGDFNLDIPGEDDGTASAGDNTDTIGDLDFGDDAPAAGGEESAPAEDKGTSEEDDLFSALDGMSDESLDDGTDDDTKSEEETKGEDATAEEKDDKEDKPAETEASEVEAPAVVEEPAAVEAPAATECGATEPAPAPVTECGATEPVTECGSTEPAPVTECGETDKVDVQLESIKANYVEQLARERVRAVVESYQQKRALAEKQALCESIIADYKARKESEERKAVVESTMGEKIGELGTKLAAMCESAEQPNDVDAQLEAIINQYKGNKELDAKLESIVNNFKASQETAKKLDTIVESVKAPAEAPAETKKSTLDAKLESIIANAKKKIAESK